MYLKSLTLRGFKSFASATTLRLEPGITCVVGPNGSGKSNIVDALSWVMGEQGAKSLRGGKMEDVVFAGTTSRAPLGRAEVALTIDNTDGALPIDYAEVTISRLMFRSGQSEYAINGDSCRLLDVQDLLSDSGLGREMHVIVGQGQLDQILHAGPEARRAIIEEAAGVLKHRKRKEKALRKLEAMQANLTRLVDLTAELNRRLKPLGRQAEVARKAATIQADLRDARLRLLADDYVTLRDEEAREAAGEAAIRARRETLERDLAAARGQEAELDTAAAAQAAELSQAQQTWFALSSLTERLRGIAGLATERVRLLSADPEPDRPGRDPDELERQAAELRDEEAGLTERLADGREALSAAVAERSAAEAALAATERRLADAARAAAGRAERLARLRGMVDAAESRSAATQEEIGRLTAAAEQARARAERARLEYSQVQDVADGGDSDRSGLAAELERAAEAHDLFSERTVAARKAERAANSEVAALRARVQALEETLRQGVDATAAVLADPGRFRGVLGPFAARLAVADGYETAIAAALGAAAEAVTVDGLESAVDVLTAIHAADAGTVGLVIAGPAASGEVKRPVLAGSARWAADLVTAPDELAGAVRDLLADVVVTADLAEAAAYVRDNPDFRAVTAAGDLLGAHWAHGGSARPQSLLDVRAAAGEAAARLTAAELTEEAAAEALAEASEAQEAARVALEETRGLMQAADAATAEISGRLGRLGGAARAAADEAKRLDASVGAARRSADKDAAKLAALKSELAEAEAEELRGPVPRPRLREPAGRRRARGNGAADRGRPRERDGSPARGAHRGGAAPRHRRARRFAGRGRRGRAHRQGADRRPAPPAHGAGRGRQGGGRRSGCRGRAPRKPHSAQADARRAAAEAASAGSTETLKAVRARVTALAGELDGVVSTAHGAEIARAEHRLRLEQLAAHAVDEYGVEPEALIAEYGPGVPVPVTGAAPRPARSRANGNGNGNGDGPPPATLADALRAVRAVRAEAGQLEESDQLEIEAEPGSEPPAEVTGVPYVRAEQEARAEAAERQLARLGKVNPLALEEYAALQERHQFLATQLEDLRKTRRDLLTVVKEVDDRVQEVFASAYADTAREFEGLFARLFPGGSGRLLLTEPDDMLTTGIEIEARPPGKKVKRLSLLSGGERSLTAIAYLFAIFKARPSPFYVLDEVEAALDDTNLQRLLRVFEELREDSQLVVITHQRRTMEAADALYGVTMRGDGVSSVISQRFREHEPA